MTSAWWGRAPWSPTASTSAIRSGSASSPSGRAAPATPSCASYAILRLARTYNRSPTAEQQRLELVYIERATLRFDLQLLWEALQAKIASRGNIKARGEPTV